MSNPIPMKKTIVNFAGFQIGWLACVLGGANALPWTGPLIAVAILGWHVIEARAWKKELALVIIITIAGSLFDQALLWLGWIQYPTDSWLIPIWMMTLWALFSSTLNISLRWMRGRHLTAFLFGFIGGPLAYLAGQKLGAMELVSYNNMLIALAIGWGLMMPAMLRLSEVLDGYSVNRPFGFELKHV